MGSASSKSSPSAPVVEDLNPDPRSPTPDVARTPLMGNDALKNKITRNADLSKTLENSCTEEKLIHNNPILSAVIRNHLQSYDPRSPTLDFDRTPIVLTSKTEDVQRFQRPEHNGSVCFDDDAGQEFQDCDAAPEVIPKNLCDGFDDATLDSTFKDPVPLGSSTASQEVIESEISIPVPTRLLETDFDYTEPSEDVKQEFDTPKCMMQMGDPPIEMNARMLQNRFKIGDADPRSPTQGIERTPIVLPRTEGPLEENVEEMSEERLVAALQNGIADLRRTPAAVADNLGLLIYEDDIPNTVELTPRKTKSATKGSRTPLSCMKNKTEERSQSAATIINGKKKSVSRIPKRVPVPREQSLQPSVEAHKAGYENTVLASQRDDWGKDSSVLL